MRFCESFHKSYSKFASFGSTDAKVLTIKCAYTEKRCKMLEKHEKKHSEIWVRLGEWERETAFPAHVIQWMVVSARVYKTVLAVWSH